MDIPLKQIRTMRIGEDHETVSVDLQNDDKLKGVISLEPLKLTTVFGQISIGIEHIKQLDVVLTGNALPESFRKGLVLYYSFDRDEGDKVVDGSGIRFDSTENGWTEQNTRVDVADKWHHLVFGRRGTEDYTYLDGELLDSTYGRRAQRNDLLDLNHTWSIGTFAGNIQRGSPQVNYSFKGRIDEIMVFNRALSEDEIKQLYDFQK